MKIAILGAGGIGGYLAARLARAGQPVALIARGAHLDAIRQNGLRLIEPDETITVRPDILTDDVTEVGTPDVIVVTVKAHQFAPALQQIAPAIGAGTRIMSVQNGVDAPDQAAEAVGRDRVLIGVARIFSNITAPGEITRYGPMRSFTIGDYEGAQGANGVPELRAVLAAAGVLSPDCANVRVDLWKKFMLFNAISSMTAGARTRVGVVRALPEMTALARRLVTETWQVARAEGVAMPDSAIDEVWDFFQNTLPDEARASTAHDLEGGIPLEIDHIAGSVARRGRALGVDVTASETIAALLAPYKNGAPG
ncbi:ketopantoate reductase family protein [Sinisalibacter aestuarii]|uniref:2-dehydropantoate 2-reductase n=1 Tax=Sinisalibacter aestuarii TaxID=2949426 RepID=A0ABQ5LTL8_9RHOB|nr:2-dehydropantoate 2-reductase [Sinisalibacter aestuarii]GKY88339.1 2-dehydropantoate 2-reductase [Sinisalibacter aestuarii]